jgi:hypothetical protein
MTYNRSEKVSLGQSLYKAGGGDPKSLTGLALRASGINMNDVNLWDDKDIQKNFTENSIGRFITGVTDFTLSNLTGNKAITTGSDLVKKAAEDNAVPIMAGMVAGYPSGRSVAGHTAAKLAPEGRVTKSRQIARNIAMVGGPAAGIGALMLAKKYKMTPALQELVAKKFPNNSLVGVDISQEILKDLKLSHRILSICTGDMGLGKYKMYDIETWMPSRNAFGETHSDSNLTDWQMRRLNTRYRTKKGEIIFPYALNNTVLASPRTLIALLENYQQKNDYYKSHT